jgi:hypothetical protein
LSGAAPSTVATAMLGQEISTPVLDGVQLHSAGQSELVVHAIVLA